MADVEDDNLLVLYRVKYKVGVATEGKHTDARSVCRSADEREMGKRVECGADVFPDVVGAYDATLDEIISDIRKVIDRARIEPYAPRHGR